MAKHVLPSAEVDRIRHEAEAVRQLRDSEGWAILQADLEEQLGTIAEKLAENRYRTKHETITTREGTTTVITTAETLIAESAGMYKMGKRVFDMIDTIIAGPGKLADLETKGVIAIQGKEVTRDESEPQTEPGSGSESDQTGTDR